MNVPQRFRDELKYLIQWVKDNPDQTGSPHHYAAEVREVNLLQFDEHTGITCFNFTVEGQTGLWICALEKDNLACVITWLPLDVINKAVRDYQTHVS